MGTTLRKGLRRPRHLSTQSAIVTWHEAALISRARCPAFTLLSTERSSRRSSNQRKCSTFGGGGGGRLCRGLLPACGGSAAVRLAARRAGRVGAARRRARVALLTAGPLGGALGRPLAIGHHVGPVSIARAQTQVMGSSTSAGPVHFSTMCPRSTASLNVLYTRQSTKRSVNRRPAAVHVQLLEGFARPQVEAHAEREGDRRLLWWRARVGGLNDRERERIMPVCGPPYWSCWKLLGGGPPMPPIGPMGGGPPPPDIPPLMKP